MTRVHVIPIGDHIQHDDTGDDCVCGPTTELIPTPHGDSWLTTHNSLDGREQAEPQNLTPGVD